MYNQRRGLAAPTQQSDDGARSQNLSLMQQKRKRQLEEQLEEKLLLLKQWTNQRGVGMRGGTVPQRDIELLEQEISKVRNAIEDMVSGGVNNSALPGRPDQQQPVSSSASSNASRGVAGIPPSSGSIASGMRPAPSTTSTARTKRDEIWEKKYNNWLERKSRAGSSASSAVPPLRNLGTHQTPVNVFAGGAPVPRGRNDGRPMSQDLSGFTPSTSGCQTPSSSVAPTSFRAENHHQQAHPGMMRNQPPPQQQQRATANQMNPFNQPSAQQHQQQQQQQPILHGRRATPPQEAQRPHYGQQQPSAQQPQQQPARQPSAGQGSEPPSHGRRAQQNRSSGFW